MTLYEFVNGFELPRPMIGVIFLAAMFVLFRLLVGRLKKAVRGYKRWQHNRRISRLKTKLWRFRKSFVVNSVETGDATVTALTRSTDFAASLIEYMIRMSVDVTRKDAPRPWDKIVVAVPKTLSIARAEKFKRPAHTGTRSDFHEIFVDLIEQLTGEVVRDLDPEEIGDLMLVISTRDPRLVVPYTTGFASPKVYEAVGPTNLVLAREIIMSIVPAATN